VVSAPHSELKTVAVQQREYGSGLYGAAVTTANGTAFYGGARSYLKGPTLATLVETEVLSVGFSSTNLTYSLDFDGPAVSCSNAGEQMTSSLWKIIGAFQRSENTTLRYDAWIPRPNTTPNSTIADGTIVSDADSNTNLRILDEISPDAARIYYSIGPPLSVQSTLQVPISVIQCALYNASWHVDFDVRSNGQQTLTSNLIFRNWMPGWSSIMPPLTPSRFANLTFDYAGLMETFGSTTSGKLQVPNDPTLPFTETSIMLETSPIMFADAVIPNITEDGMVNLQRSFESLFQNMTLSARYAVLPQQDLRGDTSLLNTIHVNATSTAYRNVYSYDARDLLITYSIAIAAGVLSVVLAGRAVAETGAMYSNSFSAVVRVTRSHTELDEVIEDEADRSGTEPLPKKIADARIWPGHASVQEKAPSPLSFSLALDDKGRGPHGGWI